MTNETVASLLGFVPFLLVTTLFETRLVRSRYRNRLYVVAVGGGTGFSLIAIGGLLLRTNFGSVLDWLAFGIWPAIWLTFVAVVVLLFMVAVTFDDKDMQDVSRSRRGLQILFRK